jgi:plasmid stabilization system protein ParE
MSRYRLSDLAEADLEEIWLYVARDSIGAADRLLAEMFETFLKLADMPYMGHLREDLVDEPLRFWNLHSYLIIYRPDADPLEIVRVVSASRDVHNLLRQ